MSNDYILLYGPKKTEDILFATNMFSKTRFIPIGWTKKNIEIIEKTIQDEISKNVKQIIFWGMEDGWDKVIKKIKKDYSEIKIKVICNTSNSLLYYDYERNNFFSLLDMTKDGLVDLIGFLRENMYKVYNDLGYKCMHLLENIILEEKETKEHNSDKINIGIYPFNYTWDKNIFNQLSVGKFIDNSIVNYNPLDNKMNEFLTTMRIQSNKDPISAMDIDLKSDRINPINAEDVANIIAKNDVNIACDFTDYVHTLYFLSMERGVPCIIGNNSELFDENIVTNSEDNPIVISQKVQYALNNRKKIIENYKDWKKQYNTLANNALLNFIKE